jgi:hypothetical protein
VLITFDASTVVSGGAGALEARYRVPMDESVLSQLPATEMLDLAPECRCRPDLSLAGKLLRRQVPGWSQPSRLRARCLADHVCGGAAGWIFAGVAAPRLATC